MINFRKLREREQELVEKTRRQEKREKKKLLGKKAKEIAKIDEGYSSQVNAQHQ